MAIPSLWDLTEILENTKKRMEVKSSYLSFFNFCFFPIGQVAKVLILILLMFLHSGYIFPPRGEEN